MKYDVILFDIDGTLCDPGTGIIDAAQYALRQLGIEEQDHTALRRFVGPPLEHSFRDYYQLSPQKVEEAVTFYREHYRQKGIAAYQAYPGIPELLQELRSRVEVLGVVTAKMNEFAEQALTNTKLIDYFDFISARQPQEVVAKSVTLKDALQKTSPTPLSSIVMIGDREHDIIAANENEIDSIGVLYGYGTRQEFVESNATHIVESVAHLRTLLLG